MKKLYILLLMVVSSVSFGQTFYSENMGTPAGTTAIAANVFQNPTPIVYTGTGDVRATSVSTGYNGASGGGNVFLNAATEYLQIDGLNTIAYNTADIQLSFGYNAGGNLANLLTIEYSTNATNWSPINYTIAATGWGLVTCAGNQIPASTTLSLRFTQPAATQVRIDDVKLSNVSASCTLQLGTATAVCDAFTTGTDTYTVTIPYTGGANATYTVAPNSGVVGGDSPTTVAAGSIIISGIPEGTAFSATVTGGTCNANAGIASPECKAVNTLPYSDTFPYAVGASLGTQQKWTNVNSGDNILGVATNLTYPGITSGDNAVAFTGAGIDCFSPYTPTTSGTLYASFIFTVSDMTNVTTDLTDTYFAAVTDAARGFKGRLFVRKNGTQWQVGLDGASTTTNYDATLRNTGDVVMVVMGYDFGTNTLNAWLNPNLGTLTAATPATLTSTPVAAITELGGFILRQDSDTKTPAITFDELRVSTTIPGLLSVNQNTAIAGLKVYPNPVTNGTLYIDTVANAEKNIVIYDVLGKQVLNTTTASSAINVASLKGGVYVLKITEDGKTATSKLVVR